MALWADQTAVATGLNGLAQGRFVGVTVSGSPTSGTFQVGDFAVSRNGAVWLCTMSGSPGLWNAAADVNNLLTTGEPTFVRDSTAVVTLTTGSAMLRLTYFTSRRTETTTQVRVVSGNTAAAATPTLCKLGLYEVDGSGGGSLVAATSNDATLYASAGTTYTRSWTNPYAKTAGRQYAFGILIVTSAGAPTATGFALASSFGNEAGATPRLTGTLTGQSDLPASFADAQIASSVNRYYGVILS